MGEPDVKVDAHIRAIVNIARPHGFSVLHAPCCDGTVSRMILEAGKPASLHGVDWSEDNVRAARRACWGLPASFEVFDLCSHTKAYAQYHLVVALGLVERCGVDAALTMARHAGAWFAVDYLDGDSRSADSTRARLRAGLEKMRFYFWAPLPQDTSNPFRVMEIHIRRR